MYIITIDGRAAAGKTTLAVRLAAAFNSSVVHMDDFFLPPELCSPDRLAEPGGNIHHERFAEEVLPHIKGSVPFSYNIFDCATGNFSGKREISNTPVLIVEGSYSCHPIFGNYMDLRIFCDISTEIQLERIIARNGETAAKTFAQKWIPLEENYFSEYKIAEMANIIAH